jgi:HPt (histidine-containing phosphotransfer) domain-containing protein
MQPPPTSSPDRITVSVDRDLQDIVPVFLANRGKDIQTLRASLLNQDFETIRILGHRMKGDGGGYGFQAISEIGGAMESAAGRHDRPAIERLTGQLEEFLARVEVVYRS